MTACQPHEESTEGPDTSRSGNVHGAFTSSLFTALVALGTRRYNITYETFQGALEAAMKGNLNKVTHQQPMHLGPRGRILFQSYDHGSPSFAYVIEDRHDSLVISRGVVAGARRGDVYHILDPRKTQSDYGAIEATTTEVQEYDSTVNIHHEHEEAVSQCVRKTGWYVTSKSLCSHLRRGFLFCVLDRVGS